MKNICKKNINPGMDPLPFRIPFKKQNLRPDLYGRLTQFR